MIQPFLQDSLHQVHHWVVLASQWEAVERRRGESRCNDEEKGKERKHFMSTLNQSWPRFQILELNLTGLLWFLVLINNDWHHAMLLPLLLGLPVGVNMVTWSCFEFMQHWMNYTGFVQFYKVLQWNVYTVQFRVKSCNLPPCTCQKWPVMLSMIASKAGVILLMVEVYLDPWCLYWANLKKKSLHVLKKIEAMHPPANSLDFVATSVSLSWAPPSRNQNDLSYLKQADFNAKQFSSTLTFSSTISPLAKGANVKPGIPKWSELMHIAAGFGYQLLI